MTTPDRDPSEVLDRIRAALLEVEAEVTARIRDALTIAQEVNDADDPEADELRDGWHLLAHHPAIRPPHWEPGRGQSYLEAVLEHLDDRVAYDAGREDASKHADPRPWQDCTVGDIRKGDLVEALDKDGLRVGVAHHQNTFGDWFTEANYLLTYDDNWPLRRIPAPTPPAEEVELPDGHPAHITDVENTDGDTCAYMALDRFGGWIGVDQDGTPREWPLRWIAAFTLPDGTRARRDGEREDGTPRFVEEDA